MNRAKIVQEEFGGLKLIALGVFEDFRGEYIETYDKQYYQEELNIKDEFIQDDISVSHKNVLRGFHGDYETAKLVQCLHGTLYNVVVDNNPNSPTYYKWKGFVLSASNRHQLYIPKGFGNAVLTLSDNAVYHYKQTTSYVAGKQFTLKWNDPKLNVNWGITNPILSDRDR